MHERENKQTITYCGGGGCGRVLRDGTGRWESQGEKPLEAVKIVRIIKVGIKNVECVSQCELLYII